MDKEKGVLNLNNEPKNTPQARKQVVLGIVRNSVGKVLIIKRIAPEITKEGETLTWAFPGGKICKDGTEEQALVREIREETGYQVVVKEKISERHFPDLNVYLLYYLCEPKAIATSVIEETHEIDCIKWVDPHKLKDFFTTSVDSGVAKYLGL